MKEYFEYVLIVFPHGFSPLLLKFDKILTSTEDANHEVYLRFLVMPQ
jgi:hypothetical protein